MSVILEVYTGREKNEKRINKKVFVKGGANKERIAPYLNYIIINSVYSYC